MRFAVALFVLLSFPLSAPAANTGPAKPSAATGADAESAALAEARYDEGEASTRSRDWKKAEASYRAATTARADFPEAWSGLGHSLKMQRRYAEALEAYERALALRPEFPQALQYLGETYVAMGRLDDARAVLAKLTPLDRDLARTLERAIDEGKPSAGW